MTPLLLSSGRLLRLRRDAREFRSCLLLSGGRRLGFYLLASEGFYENSLLGAFEGTFHSLPFLSDSVIVEWVLREEDRMCVGGRL